MPRFASTPTRQGPDQLRGAALIILLALSAIPAHAPLGGYTPAACMAIAVVQAGLVYTLFMELAEARALIRLVAISALGTALYALTLADVFSRIGS